MKYLAYQQYITAVYNCAASESNKYEFWHDISILHSKG
jgi:hypothetical protein